MSIASPFLVADEFAFEADDDWAKIPEGYEFNEVAGVSVDGDDNVYVFVRGPHPMLKFDKNGNFIKSWGEGFYGGRAHGVHVGPDGFVYVVENTRHAIDKWTRDGELVWTLGTPNQPAPKWSGQAFNLPTHMAVSAKTGDIFVGDGYGNNSVHRFSNDGKLLKTWGGHGIEPGSFQCPHNLCLDEDDYVYVCDRENNRVQVFDQEGHIEMVWHDIYRPSGICFHDGLIWVGELLHDPHPLLADCRHGRPPALHLHAPRTPRRPPRLRGRRRRPRRVHRSPRRSGRLLRQPLRCRSLLHGEGASGGPADRLQVSAQTEEGTLNLFKS